jgi:hypothetical protein
VLPISLDDENGYWSFASYLGQLDLDCFIIYIELDVNHVLEAASYHENFGVIGHLESGWGSMEWEGGRGVFG